MIKEQTARLAKAMKNIDALIALSDEFVERFE